MGWNDWDRTNRIGVVVGAALVAVILGLLVAVVSGGFPPQTGPTPEPTVSASTEQPSSTTSPTYRCTTASGSTCTEDLAMKEAAREKAYSEAEAAYSEYQAALNRGLAAGGSRTLPPDVTSVAGPELQKNIIEVFRVFENEGWYRTGESRLQFDIGEGSPEWPSTSLQLLVCVDDSGTTILEKNSNELVRLGRVNRLTAIMEKDASGWKIAKQISFEEVESC